MRLVCDTSVLVSSVLVRSGVPAQLVNAWRIGRFALVASPSILHEVQHTLNYPRIRRKYFLTDADISGLIRLLQTEAVIVPGTADVSDSQVRDPKDQHVLACAVDGAADGIVSSDKDLLVLGSYRGIMIVPVRMALEWFAINGAT
jgi:putative PIN family toxin of toxin-antitoxin system